MSAASPARRTRRLIAWNYWKAFWAIGHPPDRNPVVVSICLSIVVALWPTALGIRQLPGSLANAPDMFGQACAIAITVGAAAKVVGNLIPRRDVGMPWELMGSIILGAGAVFYAAAVLEQSGPANAALPFGMGLGLGLGCFFRAVQIILYVRGRAAEFRER